MRLPGWTERTLAYIAIVVLTAIAVSQIDGRAIRREDRAQVRTCQRVQILRDQANGYGLLIYDVFHDSYLREQKLIKGDPKNAKTHRISAKQLKRIADTTIVTGPTDCNLAIHKPDSYRAPSPEFVSKDGPHLDLLRKRAAVIVQKARTGEPLFP